MNKQNLVFIATSLDGYIADKNGGLDWLQMIANPQKNDMGYIAFMEKIDALIMGRKTFDTVANFDGEWPYSKPVFVCSNTLSTLPAAYNNKAFLVKGKPNEILTTIHQLGYFSLYIDGGATVQGFLAEDLIDEITFTQMPILLGGGIRLFDQLPNALVFEHVNTEVYLGEIVQSHYCRKRQARSR